MTPSPRRCTYIIRRTLIYRLQLTSYIQLHRKQPKVKKCRKYNIQSKAHFITVENSSLFLSVRLNCTMLPCKAPPALLPIGPRDPRLYFLHRRLRQTKFLKNITEITTRPEFAFLPLMLALRGLGAVPVGLTDGRMAHLGRGAGGNLTRPSKESPLDSKVTLFYHC